MKRWFTAMAGVLSLGSWLEARAVAAPQPRPMALLVGANAAAPGRSPLRFAHRDAELMADTLAHSGRFASGDIVTLLDPSASELSAALARAAEAQTGAESLFVFYYSGHSDGQMLFPGGEAVALAGLREQIASSPARVKVAILDTCRGGAWTGTKGLSVGPPLRAVDLLNVETSGTALLSSSSGLENAHEAAVYGGSFFTHHVAAGLLGAADASGDGAVTLQEVFGYAKERTVRDSARMALTTQHPSFEIELRGRQDIVLAELATSPSVLELTQEHALEVVHLGSGMTALETLPTQKRVRLALPPGDYVVRRVKDGRVLSKDVRIEPGVTRRLDEGELQPSTDERLALKGGGPAPVPPSAHATLPAGYWELRLALGVSTGPARAFGSVLYDTEDDEEPRLERSFDGAVSLTYAITDRLSWAVPVPAFAYRLGNEGSFEAIVRGGLTALGYSSLAGAIGTLDAGVAARTWLASDVTLLANGSASWNFGAFASERFLHANASLGVGWNVAERVAFSFGAGWGSTLELQGERASDAIDLDSAHRLVLGAVHALGYRPLPLVQVYLGESFSLDAYAMWAIELGSGAVQDRYLGGFSWAF
jgi:caspase domain-containing protein